MIWKWRPLMPVWRWLGFSTMHLFSFWVNQDYFNIYTCVHVHVLFLRVYTCQIIILSLHGSLYIQVCAWASFPLPFHPLILTSIILFLSLLTYTCSLFYWSYNIIFSLQGRSELSTYTAVAGSQLSTYTAVAGSPHSQTSTTPGSSVASFVSTTTTTNVENAILSKHYHLIIYLWNRLLLLLHLL